MKYANISTGDPLADEVKIDLNMFHVLVLDGVGGEVDGADVVAEDQGAHSQQTVELLEQLTEPGRLSHVVYHGAVLGLGVRAGDEHDIARGGPAHVWTACPVDIGVDAKLRGRGPA
jgi:hypothetical protein